MDRVKKPSPLFCYPIKEGGKVMGRPKGTKSVMRSPEEKERIVRESYEAGLVRTLEKYRLGERLLRTWRRKYRESGIDGLKSRTGKRASGRPRKPKTREEELELENLRLKIEVERLKKGYRVKGGGRKKEYVTTKGSNTKS